MNINLDNANKRIREGLNMMSIDERAIFMSQLSKKLESPEFKVVDASRREKYVLGVLENWIQQKKEGVQFKTPAKPSDPHSKLQPRSQPPPKPNQSNAPPTYPPDYDRKKSNFPRNQVPHTSSANSVSPVPTKEIGPYAIIKTLGEGTFGKVKLCQHKETKLFVAIKIILKSNVKTQKQRNSVQREVRLMKLLWHPNIIHVYDVFEDDDRIYIIMEYANGGELFDYIVARGQLNESEARSFFRQIISAVDYCHRNSIIHRDLKPENMLLDKHYNIKIIDFGFGNTFHCNRQLDTYCGSPFYAAPEMIKGHPYCGPEVDIWSLGVILYALLSGHLPFDAPLIGDLYQQIGKGQYLIPTHFTKDAVHVISRMLTVDPSKRALLSEVMNHPWVTNNGLEPAPSNYLQPRPTIITNPNPESISELVSFGISETEIRNVLSNNVGQHPISSLFHMVDEARRRKSESSRLSNRHGNKMSISSPTPTPAPEEPRSSVSSIDSDFGASGRRAGVYRPGTEDRVPYAPYKIPETKPYPEPSKPKPTMMANFLKPHLPSFSSESPSHAVINIPEDANTSIHNQSFPANSSQAMSVEDTRREPKINVSSKFFGDHLKAQVENRSVEWVAKELERVLQLNNIVYNYSPVDGGFVCEDKTNSPPNFNIELSPCKNLNNEIGTIIHFKSSRTAWSMQWKSSGSNSKKLYQKILSDIRF